MSLATGVLRSNGTGETWNGRRLPGPRHLQRLDQELVTATLAGDENAFGELVRRYQVRIFTLAYARLGSREDALDVSQEVFLKAHRKLPSFRSDGVFYTWLYRIGINACIDFARRFRRERPHLSLEGELLLDPGLEPADCRPDASPEESLAKRELTAVLHAAIGDLPETMRTAFLLFDVEGLSQEEAALRMGCPLGTAKSRIQRARLGLRDRLRHYLTC